MDQNLLTLSFHHQLEKRVSDHKLAWIIPSSLTNRGNKRYNEFIEKCKDDAVNKSIPIIDETDPKYFPYIQENLPIPRIEELKNKVNKNQKYEKKSISVVEYVVVNAMSKEHEQISKKEVIVVQEQRKKKKRR